MHIAKVHPSTVLMSCDTCGKGFHSRGNLEKHVQSDHGPKEILKEDELQPMDIDFDESKRLSKLQDEKVILIKILDREVESQVTDINVDIIGDKKKRKMHLSVEKKKKKMYT